MDFSQRSQIRAIIGQRAEFLAYVFCIMDLASLDATVDDAAGQHSVLAREQHGGQRVQLTDQQYTDLITVQLADWLEQARHNSTLSQAKSSLLLVQIMLFINALLG